MAPLKFTTTPLSYNCMRVALVLAEKGITDVKKLPADFQVYAHKTPEFLQKSPYGQIPLVEDTDAGITLYESRAIARYLALKHKSQGPDLIPDYTTHPKKFAAFEQAMSVEAMKFDPYISPLIWLKLVCPFLGIPLDEVRIKYNQEKLATNLDVTDKILATQKYMAGDVYTLADIGYMPTLHLLFFCGEAEMVTSRTNLARWWADVTARDAWKKVAAVVEGEYRALLEKSGENSQGESV